MNLRTHIKPTSNRPGFALIVTLSLMILLTVIAVGLLTLSSISLRSSISGNAAAQARANAKLALMLALNDLQVSAGPDTRITAPAGTLGDKVAQPFLTGVWSSRKLKPTSPDTSSTLTDAAKSADFKRWLVSTPDFKNTEKQDFATGPAPTGKTTRTILSKLYSNDGTTDLVVDTIPLVSGTKVDGRLAYAVFDEGIKARLNLGYKPSGTDLASRSEQLSSGQRPALDRIGGMTSLPDNDVDLSSVAGTALVSKLMTFNNSKLAFTATDKPAFDKHFNDITPYSLGLLTDVNNGGLKKDLNLLANASTSPPSGYGTGEKIYKTSLGIDVPSDPLWSQALKFGNVFNDRNSLGKFILPATGTGGVPYMVASAPKDWSAISKVTNGIGVPNPEPPTSPVLLPSIAKVQMVYSLHAHDIFRFDKDPVATSATFQNGPFNKEWKNKNTNWWTPGDANWSFKNKDRDVNYQMWVFCTPIITLHNPYNVAMEIPSGALKIDFTNVPFGMRFFVNGEAQTEDLVPYSKMFYWKDDLTKAKSYSMTLYNKKVSGSTISVDKTTAMRLLPGEVKVFSPYMNANTNYLDTSSAWYNVYNKSTSSIEAIPGWQGDGIGYGQDQPLPSTYKPLKLSSDAQGRVTGNGRMFQDGMALTGDEMLHVEFAPVPDPDQPEKRFAIEMTLKGAATRSTVLDFDYEVTDGLQTEMLGKNGTIRWPLDDDIKAADLRDVWTTNLGNFQNIKPFALLSAYAKTTHGGEDSSNEDGRYPAKPWIFNNHAGAVQSQKVLSQHPSHHSHEINLVRLPGHTLEAIDIQPGTDRGSFVTGQSTLNGRRFGTMLDFPLGPIQSPVGLNGANLAAGYYLPRFTVPIGNSFAHPVMSSSAIIESVAGQTYADHCYLLNSVFFDSYYCSGIQNHNNFLSDKKPAATLAKDFFENNKLLSDPRLMPYFADGLTPQAATSAVTADDGYQKVAACQLMKGAFNVNSTSVEAWKAVLSSLSGRDAAVSKVPALGGTSEAIEPLADAADKKGARFSRFRLPNYQPDSSDPDSLWLGGRDLTEVELDRLATEIVKQVRERGPFLSMSEFVNRQIGPSSQLTLVGALQAAIDKAKINDAEDLGGYDIQSDQVKDLKLKTPDAMLGPSAQGAPGVLTQADILSSLGNCMTVRSDTFVIRACGESVDAGGNVQARAWCEAVVQRLPEYVDSADVATTPPADLKSNSNKKFGRRFNLVAFRWLNNNEI